MPISGFGDSSKNSELKIDSSLFVQEPYLTTIYTEANIEEDIDMNIQKSIKSLPDPFSKRGGCSEKDTDSLSNNPRIMKKNSDYDFNDMKLKNIKFVKVNCQPACIENFTPKKYVDDTIDEKSSVRNNQDNDFDEIN